MLRVKKSNFLDFLDFLDFFKVKNDQVFHGLVTYNNEITWISWIVDIPHLDFWQKLQFPG